MFAETLRQLRISRRLKQRQVAEAVFVSSSAISQYETGRTMPSRETMERLSAYFGVSTDYLTGTSKIAKTEELLNEEYCKGITVSELLKKCIRISGSDRDALLVIVNALELHGNQGGK